MPSRSSSQPGSVSSSTHRPGGRRFTNEEAATIIREYHSGTAVTAATLADRHGVHPNVIQRMVSGKSYADVWNSVRPEFQEIIGWEAPRPRNRPGPANTPGRALGDLVALLKAHPGRWAWVKTTVNRPNLSWWHRSGLEAEMRRAGEGWRVYARWPEYAEQ